MSGDLVSVCLYAVFIINTVSVELFLALSAYLPPGFVSVPVAVITDKQKKAILHCTTLTSDPKAVVAFKARLGIPANI